MISNQEKILTYLAFLPIFLFPVSISSSLILAVGLLLYSINIIKDYNALKKVLTPLTLYLMVFVALGSLNICFNMFENLGENLIGFLYTLVNFFTIIFNIFEVLLTILLFVFTGLTIVSMCKNKPTIFLTSLVENIMKNILKLENQPSENSKIKKENNNKHNKEN